MNILIIGPSWVGDMVMAQSLFKVLHQLHPQVNIDVLAPAWSRPILEAMPEVRQPIDMPVGHGKLQWGVRKQVARQLQPNDYDWAIVLPNSLKSALIPWFAKIPKRTGWLGEFRYGLLNDPRKLDKQVFSLMVQKYVGLAYPAGTTPDQFNCPAPLLVPDSDIVSAAMTAFGLKKDKPVLALCPGAEFGRAKKWPEKHYAEVAGRHIERGGQVWLFGSGNDRAACDEIGQKLDAECVVNLAGDTSLQEAVALLSQADQVVANDSGLMHVAAALEKPLVAVYGSTSPGYTPPLNQQNEIIQASIECSPCFKRECPYGHYRCLEELMPDQVWTALERLQNAPETNDSEK